MSSRDFCYKKKSCFPIFTFPIHLAKSLKTLLQKRLMFLFIHSLYLLVRSTYLYIVDRLLRTALIPVDIALNTNDAVNVDSGVVNPVKVDVAKKKKKKKKKKRHCKNETTIVVSQPGRGQYNIDIVTNNKKKFNHSQEMANQHIKMAGRDVNGGLSSFYDLKIGRDFYLSVNDYHAKFTKDWTTFSQECKLSIPDFCSFMANSMGLQSKLHDEIEKFYATDELPNNKVLLVTPSMGAYISGKRADVAKFGSNSKFVNFIFS